MRVYLFIRLHLQQCGEITVLSCSTVESTFASFTTGLQAIASITILPKFKPQTNKIQNTNKQKTDTNTKLNTINTTIFMYLFLIKVSICAAQRKNHN